MYTKLRPDLAKKEKRSTIFGVRMRVVGVFGWWGMGKLGLWMSGHVYPAKISPGKEEQVVQDWVWRWEQQVFLVGEGWGGGGDGQLDIKASDHKAVYNVYQAKSSSDQTLQRREGVQDLVGIRKIGDFGGGWRQGG